MSRIWTEDKSERILGEHYRRHYDRKRRAHLLNSSLEALQSQRDRAKRKRHARYFLFFVLAFAAATLFFAVLTTFWS